jgi:hypothetical protein
MLGLHKSPDHVITVSIGHVELRIVSFVLTLSRDTGVPFCIVSFKASLTNVYLYFFFIIFFTPYTH